MKNNVNLTNEEKIKQLRKKFKPINDVIFQELFKVGNEEITKAMLSSIIKEQITDINMDVSSHTSRNYLNSKLGILDLRVKLQNNTQCNVEVQLIDYGNMIDRMLFYWAKQFSKTLNSGEDYSQLERTISIAILNFEIDDLNDLDDYCSNWKIIETQNRKKTLTNKLDLYIIELPRLLKQTHKKLNDEMTQWMLFLHNPDSMEVQEIMKENKEIKKASDKYDVILSDDELVRIAELKEKAEIDERNMKRTAKEEGIAQGLKKGIKQGLKQGIKQGIEQGLNKGLKQKETEIVKNLLKKNVSIDIIIKSTGLSRDEIEKMK